jgi:hypothetical protein
MDAWKRLQAEAARERELTRRLERLDEALEPLWGTFERLYDVQDLPGYDAIDALIERLLGRRTELVDELTPSDYPLW